MNKFAALIAGGAATLGASAASAQLTGVFTLINDDFVAANGTGDVWAFEVTNGTASDIFAINASFNGTFINGAASLGQDVGVSEPAPGFFFLETWFVGNGNATPLGVNVVDDGSTLSGELAVTAPDVFIPAGTTGTIAVFSVADGTVLDAPNFDGGQGVIDGQFVDIVYVPEPASMALLGLGGLAAAARRRRA